MKYLQIATMKEAVDKSSNNDLKQEYNRLEKFLSENGLITDTVMTSIELDDTILTYSNFQTLEDYLTTEINTTDNNYFKNNRNVLAASYNNNRNEQKENFRYKKAQYDKRYGNTGYNRPGLADRY